MEPCTVAGVKDFKCTYFNLFFRSFGLHLVDDGIQSELAVDCYDS